MAAPVWGHKNVFFFNPTISKKIIIYKANSLFSSKQAEREEGRYLVVVVLGEEGRYLVVLDYWMDLMTR